MKIGKLNKSGILKVLLGLAVAGALLLTACQDIFDMPGQTSTDDGYGYVVVDLGESARTIRPPIDGLTKYVFTFTGQDVKVEAQFDTTSTSPDPFRLPEGIYKLSVAAYVTAQAGDPAHISASGEYYGGELGDGKFRIKKGETTFIDVVLTPKTVAPGTFNFCVKLPSAADEMYTFTLQQYVGGVLGDPLAFNLTKTTPSGAILLSYTDASMPAGTYLLTGRINTNTAKYGGFSEAVHIVSYMTTSFGTITDPKDYTVTDALASITSGAEAIAILKKDIVNWITPKNADGTPQPLAKVNGIDVSGAGVIKINYVAKNQDNTVRTPLGTGTTFPIAWQGGWAVSANSNGGLTATVGNNDKVTRITLANSAVQANIIQLLGGSADTVEIPTIFVDLCPVAEYNVVWGNTVGASDQTGRSILIKDNGNANNPSSGLNVTLDNGTIGTGIGVIGSTDITITNSAIRVDEGPGIPQTGTVYNFTAESKAYNVEIFQDIKTQVKRAFETLESDLVNEWVVNKTALAREKAADFSASANVNTEYGPNDTVTLYYVRSRLGAAVKAFQLNLPFTLTTTDPKRDPRWEPPTDWNIPNGSTDIDSSSTAADILAVNGGDTKTISYKPYGGDRVPYTVKLIPVAEFYVNFADIPALMPSDSKITIDDKVSGTAANKTDFTLTSGNTGAFAPAADFSDPTKTPYKGKKYILGNINIALTNTAITLDIPTDDPANKNTTDLDVDTSDAVNTTLPANNANRPSFANFVSADGGKGTGNAWGTAGGTGAAKPDNSDVIKTNKDIFAISREYHIKVYRTTEKQKTDAVAEVRNETSVDLWTANTKNSAGVWTADYVNKDGGLLPRGIEATSTVGDNTSNIIYVNMGASGSTGGSQTAGALAPPTGPTIKVRNDYVAASSGNAATGIDFEARGWSLNDADPAQPSTNVYYEGSTKGLAFTPYGGYKEQSVYKFRLIPAAKYKVVFKGYPIGADKAQGTITVLGSVPGGTGADGAARKYSKNTDSTDQVRDLIYGLGSPINVLNDTGGLNIISTSYDDNSEKKTTVAIGVASAGPLPESIEYTINVYPSVAQQQQNVFDTLKAVTRASLPDWTSGGNALTASTSIKDIPATGNTAATDNYTGFWIVANPIPDINVPTITGFWNATDYGLASVRLIPDNDATSTGTATLDAFGNKKVPIKFVPYSTPVTANGDDKTYEFRLTAVAQYDVVFMNGPTGNRAIGTLSINTYKPGTVKTTTGSGGSATVTVPADSAVLYSSSHNDPVRTTYYGGIGDFSDLTTFPAANPTGLTRITAKNGGVNNIIAHDIATKDTFVATATAANFVEIEANQVSSRVYTIRVFPTVAAQVADMKAKMDTYKTSAASGWFSNLALDVPASARPLITPNFSVSPSATDTIEVQYLHNNGTGDLVPAVQIISNFGLQGGAGYTGTNFATGYVFAPGTPVDASTGPGVENVPLSFKPIGANESAQTVYTIRTIPVVKYTVTYSQGATGTGTTGSAGAMGTVMIKQTNANSRPKDDLTFNTSTQPQVGYSGRGTMTVQMSATKGSYDEVIIRKKGVNASTQTISEPANGGLSDVVTFVDTASAEYEIIVNKY